MKCMSKLVLFAVDNLVFACLLETNVRFLTMGLR